MDHTELTDFLHAANKATYANREAPKAKPLRPSSEDYHFEKDDLAYHDTYFGSRDFIGEEVVYKTEKPVWAMNYYGFVLNDDISTADAYKILRSALMQEYDDILPVRGPREYSEGEYTYRNSVEGYLDRFMGTEEILLSSEVIYQCWYHGGMVR